MSFFKKNLFDYIKGFIEIVSIDIPRYSFIVRKINLLYPNNKMAAQIIYQPVGCHREYSDYVSKLNTDEVFSKFRSDHARIIVGIDTLQHSLDLEKKEHVEIYLKFVELCTNILRN